PLPGEAIQDLPLQPNQSQIMDFRDLKQVAIVNPLVADVLLVGANTLVLTAKAPGETLLFVTHAGGRTIFRVSVAPPPAPDLKQLASQIEAGINRPGVTVRAVGRGIVIEGEVANQAELDRANAIVRAFGVEAQNLVKVAPTPPPPPGPPAEEIAVESIRKALGIPSIIVRAVGPNKVAIEGKAASQAEADRIRRVVAAVLAGTGVELVDLLQIPTPEPPTRKQVLIRARVVEINKTDRADLGVEWIPTQVIPATGTAPATITPLTQPFLFS